MQTLNTDRSEKPQVLSTLVSAALAVCAVLAAIAAWKFLDQSELPTRQQLTTRTAQQLLERGWLDERGFNGFVSVFAPARSPDGKFVWKSFSGEDDDPLYRFWHRAYSADDVSRDNLPNEAERVVDEILQVLMSPGDNRDELVQQVRQAWETGEPLTARYGAWTLDICVMRPDDPLPEAPVLITRIDIRALGLA